MLGRRKGQETNGKSSFYGINFDESLLRTFRKCPQSSSSYGAVTHAQNWHCQIFASHKLKFYVRKGAIKTFTSGGKANKQIQITWTTNQQTDFCVPHTLYGPHYSQISPQQVTVTRQYLRMCDTKTWRENSLGSDDSSYLLLLTAGGCESGDDVD